MRQVQQIDVEPRIAVQQKEALSQAVARMPDGTACTSALRLDRNLDLKTKADFDRGRRCVFNNAMRRMTSEQQHSAYAMAAQFEQQHVEKRDAIDRQQWLWCLRRQRPKPAAE